MKIDIKKNIFNLINIILALVLVLTPNVLFPICSGLNPMGKPMKCYYSAKAILIIAVLMVLVSVLALIISKKGFNYIAYILVIAGASLSYMIPKRIIEIGHKEIDGWECGLCAKPDMSCLHTTLPALTVILIIFILVNIAGLAFNFLGKE